MKNEWLNISRERIQWLTEWKQRVRIEGCGVLSLESHRPDNITAMIDWV